MANATVKKKAYYLRALQGGSVFDLQKYLKRARKAKSTVADTEVPIGEQIIRIQKYKDADDFVRVQLTCHIPGEKAATLKSKAIAAEDNEGSQNAPDGSEFKSGDSFFLVKGHHVVFCGNGISVQKSAAYLMQLFIKIGVDKKDCAFELSPAANLDRLKIIQDHGVRSISLSANAFDISIPKNKRSDFVRKILGNIPDEFRALMAKDQSVAEQKALEDLVVNVEIRLDGNSRAELSAKTFIESMAEAVLADDQPISEFAIITQRNNERITSDDIRLQTFVSAQRINGSLNYSDVWGGLDGYYMELKKANLLEQ